MNKRKSKLLSLVLATLVACTPILQVKAETQVRLQDDFYTAINKEWMDQAVIKPGYTDVSNFTELSDRATEAVEEVFEDILKNEDTLPKGSTSKKMVTLYKNYIDLEARNEQGVEPIRPYLEALREVQTVKAYTKLMAEKDMEVFNPLYSFHVTPDMKDSNQNTLTLVSGVLQLKDPDHYNEPAETSNVLREATRMYLEQLFKLAGYTEEESQGKVNLIFGFEEKLAPFMMGTKAITTHPNIYEAIYNPVTLKDIEAQTPHLELAKVMKKRDYHKAERLILQEPKWLQALDTLYTDENLAAIKACTEAAILRGSAAYLSQAFVEAGEDYVAAMMGIKGERSIQQKAFQAVNMAFTEEIGRLYVEKCFSKEAKEDVKAMVDEIIVTYKKRIEKLDWMSAETKENALMKLDKMKVKIGYPDKWEGVDGLKLKAYEDGGSLVGNMLSIQSFFRVQELKEVNKPVDKGQFLMPPQMVNACYAPLSNDITFPVAILQPPFYDIDAKKETNMGAIGIVIAHEITHAFDNTGARFDGDGNLANWWGEEDYKRFEEKAKKVRDYYGKIEVLPGQYINGDLTVGENIADIGAMACMLDMMEDLPDADYKAFFESWATVWRSVAPEAFRIQLLQRDSHAPNKERVNEVVKQFEAFYETYDITEKDGMYLDKEERLSIW